MQLPVTLGTATELRNTREVLGITCREGTLDDFVAREISSTYGWMDVAGKRVLDIGGNIGAYARWALVHGAAHVRSIEPEASNYVCLGHNTRLASLPMAETIHSMCSSRALVAAESGVGEIWLSPTGKNPGNTSSVKYRGRVSQGEIPMLAFGELLAEEEPDVLKIDVEGAEYDFFHTAPLPDCVRQVTMEIHLSRPHWREKDGPAIAATFADWDCVRAPKFEGGHWQTIGAWRR